MVNLQQSGALRFDELSKPLRPGEIRRMARTRRRAETRRSQDSGPVVAEREQASSGALLVSGLCAETHGPYLTKSNDVYLFLDRIR